MARVEFSEFGQKYLSNEKLYARAGFVYYG